MVGQVRVGAKWQTLVSIMYTPPDQQQLLLFGSEWRCTVCTVFMSAPTLASQQIKDPWSLIVSIHLCWNGGIDIFCLVEDSKIVNLIFFWWGHRRLRFTFSKGHQTRWLAVYTFFKNLMGKLCRLFFVCRLWQTVDSASAMRWSPPFVSLRVWSILVAAALSQQIPVLIPPVNNITAGDKSLPREALHQHKDPLLWLSFRVLRYPVSTNSLLWVLKDFKLGPKQVVSSKYCSA